uniref:Putative transposase domain-containing protein n=1 Tax=Ixodes ricinus TaxID=34613 RepID=A0A0K8R9P3_IXORI
MRRMAWHSYMGAGWTVTCAIGRMTGTPEIFNPSSETVSSRRPSGGESNVFPSDGLHRMAMHARGFVRLRRCETSTVRLNSRRGSVGEPGTTARTPTMMTATSLLYPYHCHRHQHLPRHCIKLLKRRVIFLVQRIMMSNKQLSHG